ncbi:MAG: hypothetical protein ACRD0L_11950 [Acidimicrobiales bacterium]
MKLAAYSMRWTLPTGRWLLPGSQHPEQTARLAAYRNDHMRPGPGRDPAAPEAVQGPGYVAGTRPGDVIAFDLQTWHASFGGRDRLAWTAVYLRCPESEAERDRTLRSMTGQLRAGVPRLRPGPLPDLAGLAGRCRHPPPARRGHRADAGRSGARPRGRRGRLVNLDRHPSR